MPEAVAVASTVFCQSSNIVRLTTCTAPSSELLEIFCASVRFISSVFLYDADVTTVRDLYGLGTLQ